MQNNGVKNNFIYNTLLNVIILIIPLLTTPYISRVLGAEEIGQWSFCLSIVTYFTVFSAFGSSVYGQRKTAFVRENKEKLSEIFWNVFSFRFISSGIALIVYCVYLKANNLFATIAPIFAVLIIDVAIDISWFFQGIEQFKKLVLRNLVIRLFGMICVFVFVQQKEDIGIYSFIYCCSLAIGNLSLWPLLFKIINKPKAIHPFDGLSEMLLVFLPTIATQIYCVLDKSMIGWITGSNYANGCYEQSEKLARVALTVVASVGTVMLPRIANLHQKNDRELIATYMSKSYKVTWMLALPIVFGLISISSVFIPIFLGPGFDDAVGLLQIFSLLVLFVGLANTTGRSYLISTKQQNVYTVSVFAAAVTNFIMNMILIPKFSAFGAAIASVTAEGIGCIIQISYCLITKQFNEKIVFESTWKYLLASIVMFILVEVIKTKISSTVINLIILICGGAITYAVMLLVLKDSFFISNVKTVLKKFRVIKGA